MINIALMWIKSSSLFNGDKKITLTIRITTKVISITLDGDQKSPSPFDGTKNLFTIKLLKFYFQSLSPKSQ